jgi:hypothetical protein
MRLFVHVVQLRMAAGTIDLPRVGRAKRIPRREPPQPSPSGSTSVFAKNLRLAEILGEKEDRHDVRFGRAEALLLVCGLFSSSRLVE